MLFSVLIPAYKTQYLEECICSILSQSFADFEIIIVNDASPEKLDSVISKFSDKRIKYYVNEKNCGAINVVDNWNNCLQKSQGDFVICMGDDDVLMPNCLYKYSKCIESNPQTDVFHCRSYIIDDNSEKVSMTPSWPEQESIYENIWHRIHDRRIQYIGDFLYRRESLLKKGGFYKLPMAWGSDDITSFIMMEENGIVHINEPLFCYRDSGVTLSSSGSVLSKLEAISREEDWYNDFLRTHNPISLESIVLFKDIKKEKPHYFKIKRINTIAYYGFKGNMLMNLIQWYRRSNVTKLKLKELIYVAILAYKKRLT